MDFINSNILTLIVFSPVIFAAVTLIVPAKDRGLKWTTLIFSLVPLALTIYLWLAYPGMQADPAGYKF
ncbi:MAG TPA: hypothetical protein VII92_15420, partial [Anaerolineae bacterium]